MEVTRPPRSVIVAALLVGAGGLASCATTTDSPAAAGPSLPSATVVAGGKYVTTVDLDHGGLVVSPPGRAVAHVSRAAATAMFEAADVVEGVHTFAIIGLGLVTVSTGVTQTTTTVAGASTASTATTTTMAPTTTTSATTAPNAAGSTITTVPTSGPSPTVPSPPLLPRYQDRLAWVGIAWGAAVGCPGSPGTPSIAERDARFVAVLVDAHTGHSVLAYTSGGTPPCGGASERPTLSQPGELVSVAWDPVGPGSTAVNVSVPACGRVVGWTQVPATTGAAANAVQVEVLVPFDPSCGTVTPTTQAIDDVVPLGSAQAQVPHAPLGPVAGLQPPPES